MGGHTRIDKALRLAQNEMFTEKNGARLGIPKLIILLTDGSQTWTDGSEDPIVVSEELRKSGVNVVVVGIGSRVNSKELKAMAGRDDRVFSADSFEQLVTDEFVEKISSSTCDCGKYPK